MAGVRMGYEYYRLARNNNSSGEKMSNFLKVKKFMDTYGQEVKYKT